MVCNCLQRMNTKVLLLLCIMIISARAFAQQPGKEIGKRFALRSMSSVNVADSSATEQMRKDAQVEMDKLEKHYAAVHEQHPATKLPSMWNIKEEASSFVNQNIDAVLFDCDGVIYRSPDPAPGARQCIQALLDRQKKVFFVTNNAGSNRMQLREKLVKILEIENLTDEMMVSSSYSCAMYLKREILDKKGSSGSLYVIGSDGLCEELRQVGFHVSGGSSDDKPSMTRDELAEYPFPENPIDAVVVGHDVEFNFRKLCVANVLLQMNQDAPLIATNKDSFDLVGVDARHIPGNGALVSALEYASRRTAINVGKPSKTLADLIVSEHGINPSRSMIVGDRLDTDIRFGIESGIHAALVMTGVTTAEQIIELGDGTTEEPLPNIILPHIGLLA